MKEVFIENFGGVASPWTDFQIFIFCLDSVAYHPKVALRFRLTFLLDVGAQSLRRHVALHVLVHWIRIAMRLNTDLMNDILKYRIMIFFFASKHSAISFLI